MRTIKPTVGDYIETSKGDTGRVIAVKGRTVFFHSETTGRTEQHPAANVVVCPTEEQVQSLKQAIRESHGGQPRECNPGPGPDPPLGVQLMVRRRGNNNYLRG